MVAPDNFLPRRPSSVLPFRHVSLECFQVNLLGGKLRTEVSDQVPLVNLHGVDGGLLQIAGRDGGKEGVEQPVERELGFTLGLFAELAVRQQEGGDVGTGRNC